MHKTVGFYSDIFGIDHGLGLVDVVISVWFECSTWHVMTEWRSLLSLGGVSMFELIAKGTLVWSSMGSQNGNVQSFSQWSFVQLLS